MIIINSLQQLHRLAADCVVALGTFDGLHRGHLDVIAAARRRARETGSLLAVFTFSNHPLSVLAPEKAPQALIDAKRRQQMLAELGADVLLEIPFDEELLNLPPAAFLERLLQLGVSAVAVGENFTYGKGGAGNITTLAAASETMGFELIVRPLLKIDGLTVSSTAIRKLITAGEVRQAARLLGREYEVCGVVAHGNERGRTIGFPTANIELAGGALTVPLAGVYAARVMLADGTVYGGMANIGKNPTFGDVRNMRLETHLFAYSGNLYGKQIRVAFIERVRGEVKFASAAALQEQLEKDRKACKKLLR